MRRHPGCLTAIALVAIVVPLSGWRLLLNWQEQLRDYQEAEQLVPVVWPLSESLEDFWSLHQRPPRHLQELDEFAHNEDFSPLARYPCEFPERGPLRFIVRANSRFALIVDQSFSAGWKSL